MSVGLGRTNARIEENRWCLKSSLQVEGPRKGNGQMLFVVSQMAEGVILRPATLARKF